LDIACGRLHTDEIRTFVRRNEERQMTGETADNAFGRLLRARRRSLGLRQDELADLAGVSERFVYALESGKKSVQMDKAIAVLGALGLHLELRRGARADVQADLPSDSL
jgi:HTH-type transcriptional regulator/antitoxin HipB